MPDYINIISKEAITGVPSWIAILGAIICTAVVASTFIYWAVVKDPFKVSKYLAIVGSCAIVLCVAWCCVTSIFFKEPTGKYKYAVTINKDIITVSQYEKFIKEYNPMIYGDVYYFEAADIDEGILTDREENN